MRPSDRHAARHLNYRTIDIAGLVARQEGVDVGDFFRLAQTPERNPCFHVLQDIAGNGAENRRGLTMRCTSNSPGVAM